MQIVESEYRELVDEVFRKVGRNILLFQQIEKGLKLLLPFINPGGSVKEIGNFHIYKKKVKLQTLGNLINSYIESVDYKIESVNHDSDYFVEDLKRMVENRNKLVHHFGESQGLNILNTKEGCRDCLIQLESQHKEAVEFYKDLKLLVFGLLGFIRENYSESNPKIDLLYKQLKADIIDTISEVEFINLANPSETLWENTRIVKLLRLAELKTDKIDDMTVLAKAGQFIKSQDSDCTPKKYGIKTLKGILKVSGLFEIIDNQDDEQKEVFILYKSKS